MKNSPLSRWTGGDHHRPAFYDRKKTINGVVSTTRLALRRLGKQYQGICLVGTGISGSLLVPEVASRLDVPFVLIRERGAHPVAWRSRRSNHERHVIGVVEHHAIFIDDLYSQGRTIERVFRLLKKEGIRLIGAVFRESHSEMDPLPVGNTKIPIWLP